MSSERGYPDQDYVYLMGLSGSGLCLLNAAVRIWLLSTERGYPNPDYVY
jgi:hypothetical protein